jgi:hypothetical protein
MWTLWIRKMATKKTVKILASCDFAQMQYVYIIALAAWRSGHCIRLRNKKTRVQIPPGYKVFRET